MRLFRLLITQLLAVAFFLAPMPARAGYALPVSPPAGFSTSGGVNFYGGSAANAPWVNGSAAASVTYNVGGRAVSMPVSMRLASNAASFAVAAVRASPGALAVGAIAAWLGTFGLAWVTNQWMKTTATETWSVSNGGCGSGADKVALSRCSTAAANSISISQLSTTPATVITNTATAYKAGWTYLPNGNVLTNGNTVTKTGSGNTTAPAVEGDWIPPTTATTLPDDAANQVRPTTPLPIQLPLLNPNPQGVPQPLTVPNGEPVPVAGTSPQEYRQPVVDLWPAPLVDSPFRVDEKPGELVTPNPITQPMTNPGGSGATPLEKIEIETCGLPGKPPCKIDEQGTPTDTASPAGTAAITAAKQAQIDAIGTVVQPTELGWAFGITLPAGTCSALTIATRIGTASINPCGNSWVEWMRTVIAWCFGIGCALYIWRSVNETVGSAR